jgi:hypothetical protein
LGEEILVDAYNSSVQFGRSSARSTSSQIKQEEGNSFQNFVFRVRVSGILVVIIRLFVCLLVAASSCVLWILPAIFPLQTKKKKENKKPNI